RTSSAATRPERVPSWPTTTFATSSRKARIGPRASVSDIKDLLADGVELGCEHDQSSFVGYRHVADGVTHPFAVEVGARRDDFGERLWWRAGREPIAFEQL